MSCWSTICRRRRSTSCRCISAARMLATRSRSKENRACSSIARRRIKSWLVMRPSLRLFSSRFCAASSAVRLRRTLRAPAAVLSVRETTSDAFSLLTMRLAVNDEGRQEVLHDEVQRFAVLPGKSLQHRRMQARQAQDDRTNVRKRPVRPIVDIALRRQAHDYTGRAAFRRRRSETTDGARAPPPHSA
jgi:hypothetical protein